MDVFITGQVVITNFMVLLMGFGLGAAFICWFTPADQGAAALYLPIGGLLLLATPLMYFILNPFMGFGSLNSNLLLIIAIGSVITRVIAVVALQSMQAKVFNAKFEAFRDQVEKGSCE